jgi:hypothetical protein
MQQQITIDWDLVTFVAVALAIYFVLFEGLPFLYRKKFGSQPAQQMAGSKGVQSVVNVVTQKPVFSYQFEEVSGETAMAAYEAAKTASKGIPVLIGGGEHYRQSIADDTKYRKSPQEYLALATASPEPYVYRAKPRTPKTWEDVEPFSDDGQPFLVKEFDGSFKPIVTLAFIPAQSNADIPAYIWRGGWNGVAEADVSVALFRKWQRDFGAEIVAVSLDAIDVRVARKPATRDEALVLAREHLRFCATGATLAETAAELMATNRWHFYWD